MLDLIQLTLALGILVPCIALVWTARTNSLKPAQQK